MRFLNFTIYKVFQPLLVHQGAHLRDDQQPLHRRWLRREEDILSCSPCHSPSSRTFPSSAWPASTWRAGWGVSWWRPQVAGSSMGLTPMWMGWLVKFSVYALVFAKLRPTETQSFGLSTPLCHRTSSRRMASESAAYRGYIRSSVIPVPTWVKQSRWLRTTFMRRRGSSDNWTLFENRAELPHGASFTDCEI